MLNIGSACGVLRSAEKRMDTELDRYGDSEYDEEVEETRRKRVFEFLARPIVADVDVAEMMMTPSLRIMMMMMMMMMMIMATVMVSSRSTTANPRGVYREA